MFSKINRLFVSGVIMASAVGVTNHGFAATTSDVAVQAQTFKLEQLKSRFESLKSSVNELNEFNKALASAERTKAGWTFLVEHGSSFSGGGTFISGASLIAMLGARVFPEIERVRRLNKPAAWLFVGGIVLIATGLTSEFHGRYAVEMADADIKAAQSDITQRLAYIETEKGAIAKLSEGYGATISNSVISFEGVPQGLQVFGGSSLNLNDLKGVLPNQ